MILSKALLSTLLATRDPLIYHQPTFGMHYYPRVQDMGLFQEEVNSYLSANQSALS